MSKEQALAGLRDVLDQRTVELDAAIAKLKVTPREADEYGAVYETRWEASEAYDTAWAAWHEATGTSPAGVTAGDDTNRAGSLREAMDDLSKRSLFSEVDTDRLKLDDESLNNGSLRRDYGVQDADLVSKSLVGVLRQRELHLGIQELIAVHQASPSVGGAPIGAGVGTSESIERDRTPGLPELKKHPAAVTAGCDETKNQNGK